MNIYPHIPYTYLIGWSAHNKYYYGVQFGKNANPINLWSTYFTSSKPLQKFRDQYGEPDIIQVRKCFYNKDDAIEWEVKALKRIKSKDIFLNRMFGTVKGLILTDEMREKISNHHKGKSLSDMHREKLSLSHKGKPPGNKGMKMRPISDETRQKLKAARKLRIISDETKEKRRIRNSLSKWINNGKENKFVPNYLEYIADGWQYGMVK